MSGIAGILNPGRALIPGRDTPGAALVEDSKTYHPHAEQWLHNEYGLNLVAGQPLAVNTWRKVARR